MSRPLPAIVSWLLRLAVPVRWVDSVHDDLEAEWHARLRGRGGWWRAPIGVTLEALGLVARLGLAGAREAAAGTWRDGRDAARALRRHPQYALGVIVTVALGIGFNTAAYAVMDRVVFAPLPYADPDRLVELHARRGHDEPERTVSGLDVDLWREGLATLVDVAAYQPEVVPLRLGGRTMASPIAVAHVSSNLLDVLGIVPVRGRRFRAGEGRLGQPGVAIVSQHVWHSLAGASDAVGQTIDVGGRPCLVVGVVPGGVEFPAGVGVWLARETGGARLRGLQIEFASLQVVGRLRGAGPPSVAAAAIASHGSRIAREAGRAASPMAVPLHRATIASVLPALQLGWAAVGILFLVACANAAGLLLARTAAREHELAVRASLGASRGAIVRHVVFEGVWLAVLGCALGLLLAVALLEALARSEPAGVARLADATLSASSVTVALALAAVAGFLVSVVPAAGAVAQRGGAARVVPHPARTFWRKGREALVAGQLAVSVLLLTAAVTAGLGVLQVLVRDPGFDEDVLVVSLRPDPALARQGPGGAAYAPLLERLAAIDGVAAVAMTDHLPPSVAGQFAPLAVEGDTVAAVDDLPTVRMMSVSPTYFATLRIPVVAGRGFTQAEVAHGAPVAVVDEQVAARAGGREAVGRRAVVHGRVLEIVGIVARTSQGAPFAPPEATVYRPLSSGAHGTGGMTFLTEQFVLVRPRDPADGAVVAAAVRTVLDAPPRVADVTGVTTIADQTWSALATPRFHAALFAIFAAFGTALAVLGVYGLVSYVVQLAAAEIGVRLVLGATTGDVIGLVLRRGLRVAVVGLGLGTLAAPGVLALMRRQLEGAQGSGPMIFATVVALLGFAVTLGCLVPACRAAAVDPVDTLRRT